MTLSAQSIAEYAAILRMIEPFFPDKIVVNGKSAGLSCASYDMTIGHDLVIGIHPAFIIQQHILDHGFSNEHSLRTALSMNPSHTALAHTEEDLRIPTDVSAQVCDKSSYARIFCSAFNTFIDPGFKGNLTLELVNHGDKPVLLKKGDPIVQVLFTLLDKPTDRPYAGKYQHQTKAAHAARFEENL